MLLDRFVQTVILWLAVTSATAFAGEVTEARSMQFGVITLHPDGDTIVIEALDGPASPQAPRSHVEGGQSGLLTIRSESAEQVQIDYPNSVILTNGEHFLTISDINENSEYGDSPVSLPGGEATIDIAIGGSLTLTGNEAQGAYNGSITIGLTFY